MTVENKDKSDESDRTVMKKLLLGGVLGVGSLALTAGPSSAQTAGGTIGTESNPATNIYVDRVDLELRTSNPTGKNGMMIARGDL